MTVTGQTSPNPRAQLSVVAMLLGPAAIGVGLLLLALAGPQSITAFRLMTGHISEVEGRVTGKTVVHIAGKTGARTDYHLQYVFTPKTSVATFDGDGVVASTGWNETAVGDAILVSYVIEDPGVNYPFGNTPLFSDVLAFVLLPIVALFLLVGVAVPVLVLRRYRLDQRLIRTGIETTGTIVKLAVQPPTNKRGGGMTAGWFMFRYQYAGPNGASHKGWSKGLAYSDRDHWHIGDSVHVRYDPANPSRSECWDTMEFMVSQPAAEADSLPGESPTSDGSPTRSV